MADGPKEQRSHPRLAVRAAFELTAPDERVVLQARNVSLGGAALACTRAQAGRFPVGSRHPIALTEGAADPIRTTALVVRHDGDGIAVRWIIGDPGTATALARLIEKLPPRR